MNLVPVLVRPVLSLERGLLVFVYGLVFVNFVFLGQGLGTPRVGVTSSSVGVGVISTEVGGIKSILLNVGLIVALTGVGLILTSVVTTSDAMETNTDVDGGTEITFDGVGVGKMLFNAMIDVSRVSMGVLVRAILITRVVGFGGTVEVRVGFIVITGELMVGGFSSFFSISELIGLEIE